jgi:Fic family protein
MKWNWQQSDWPNFRWEPAPLATREERFLLGAGVMVGAVKHLSKDEHGKLIVEVVSQEALTTSEIEGEVLNRASVQSSIQRQLGLAADKRRAAPAEEGVAEMMVGLFRSIQVPLSAAMLFGWHRAVIAGRRDLRDVGRYRTNKEPMQVVSGRIGAPRVHFEAPPAGRVAGEMRRFIAWFNRTGPAGAGPLPALTRAGIAHLYFESIHPFEDGNGRIGRGIAEKALGQGASRPAFTGLSVAILAQRKSYYLALERANKKNEVTEWLQWFADTVLDAQRRTLELVEFLIAKAKLLERLKGQLNSRQQKALLRVLREGPDGFEGGLSAGKYGAITGASPATATRDLAGLVEMGALIRTGELKYARYAVNLPQSR